ncbi:hypothetical protein TELCIR_08747 [Teladorsagia circumcincta]|uniref:Bestrophin homolog n=1 Tax=Teladorsagia circumcincta TaxID=45464 RepID=A0A2G9UGS3_TELCI|nr:hypothetical protein TELCIR_08747 [Teladorsagia circumcincta]
MMHNLLSYDWVNVPLVYTQGPKLWINDFVIPVYNVYEFIFFVGWLKVAQVMLNPFGLDEDDFEIDMLIERNLQVAYSYVESMYDRLPPLILVDVSALPHTKASMALIKQANPMVGSVANVNVPRDEQQVITKEDVEMIRKLLKGISVVKSESELTVKDSVEQIKTASVPPHSVAKQEEKPKMLPASNEVLVASKCGLASTMTHRRSQRIEE